MNKQKLASDISTECYFEALELCTSALELAPSHPAFLGKSAVYNKVVGYASRFISLRAQARSGEIGTIAAIIVNKYWPTESITPQQIDAAMIGVLFAMSGVNYRDINDPEPEPQQA